MRRLLLPSFARVVALWALAVLLGASVAQAGPPASVTVDIQDPLDGAIIGESVDVTVEVTSTFEIDTVVADLDGQVANLSFDGGIQWSGTVDATGFTWGTKTLTVTATDTFGNQGADTTMPMFDLPPVVTVTTPQDFQVVDNSFQVEATCVDDDPAGCTRVEMTFSAWSVCGFGPTIVAANSASLNQTANLPQFGHGDRISTCIRGIDSSGQQSGQLTHLWFVDQPLMEEVESTTGWIVDVNEQYLLYVDRIVSGRGEPFGLRNRTTGIETVLFDDRDIRLDKEMARATPFGLVSRVEVNNAGWSDFFWDLREDGTLFDLGSTELTSQNNLKTEGPWAGYHKRTVVAEGFTTELILRNLETEIETVVGQAGNFDLTEDGTAVYGTSTGALELYDGSVTTLLDDPLFVYFRPEIEGDVVAFAKRTRTSPVEYAVALLEDGVETVIDPLDPDNPTDLRLGGGWLAFQRLGTTGQEHVWVRSPAGVETQLSFFSTNSDLMAINRRGDLVWKGAGKRWLNLRGSTTAIDLGDDSLDEIFWVGDELFAAYGRNLYKVRIDYFGDGFESGDLSQWSTVVQ